MSNRPSGLWGYLGFVGLLAMSLTGCQGGKGQGGSKGRDSSTGQGGGKAPDAASGGQDARSGPDAGSTAQDAGSAADAAGAAQDAGAGQDAPLPVFAVDPGLRPAAPSIPGLDGMGPERPLGQLRNPRGATLDFTLNELVVASNDQAAVDALAKRWNGAVLQEISFADKGLGSVPKSFLIKVDPSRADSSKLPSELRRLAPGVTGETKVSSEAALKLLAVAAEEAGRQGLRVGVNPLFQSQGVAEGSTQEASSGVAGYMKDACTWPYMNKGSNQDFGVCAAWQLLAQQGKLGNKVKVMVMDGGFVPSADFPSGARIYPPNAWRIMNPDPRCAAAPAAPGMAPTSRIRWQPCRTTASASPVRQDQSPI